MIWISKTVKKFLQKSMKQLKTKFENFCLNLPCRHLFCIFLQFSPFLSLFSCLQWNFLESFFIFQFLLCVVHWPPEGESIPISVSYLNNKKSFMFRTHKPILNIRLFFCVSLETLRTCINFQEVTKSPAGNEMKNAQQFCKWNQTKVFWGF